MNKVFFNLEQSAAFTGHRKVPYGKQREVELKLNKTIREHYKKGIRDFLCGMAFGFDMFAAEAVINLKKELPHIRLIAVVPYRGQCERWSAILQSKYRELLNQADRAIIVSSTSMVVCLEGMISCLLILTTLLLSSMEKSKVERTTRHERRRQQTSK